MRIALFNPNKNLYSETFIEAHKLYLKQKVFFYYGHAPNIHLEGFEATKKGLFYWLRILFYKITGTHKDTHLHKWLLKSLQKNKIDVILVEYGPHAHKLLPVLKVANLPFVVHFHGYDASRTKVLETYSNYADVFSLATKVIGVSKVMCSKLLDMGCPKDKLVYNVYGPSDEFKNIHSDFSKNQFLSIGRFTDKKAPYYTILAFSKVLDKHPEAKLIMAGDGPLLNTCVNLASHLGISDNVVFSGVISHTEIIELIKTSLAYVQHSVIAIDGDMEGTPLSILETSLAGLPVIATKHAGIPDVVLHKKTGLLCDEHDVTSMSNHMQYVLDNKDEAMNMGASGKKHITENYSITRHIEQLQAILEDAAAKS